MRIQIVSDLHLEFSDINIQNNGNADVLVLSGDIMTAETLYDCPAPLGGERPQAEMAVLGRNQIKAQRFRDFLKRCSFQFPHVIYIAGNHEFYHGKWKRTLSVLRDECAKFSNVYFMEDEAKKIDDVTFIAGTLWTDMNKHDPITLHAVRDMMNDFKLIVKEDDGYTRLKPADTVVRHKKTLGYIKQVVAEKHDEKFVVVGHHSPSFMSVHDDYKSSYLMNGAYHSDLSDFILDRPQIKLWTHGHTHYAFDYMLGVTRIVCNPRGYRDETGRGEDSGWDQNKTVEI